MALIIALSSAMPQIIKGTVQEGVKPELLSELKHVFEGIGAVEGSHSSVGNARRARREQASTERDEQAYLVGF
jgi:hypothetical protein